MDPISLILTIVGLMLSIGVAYWQHRRAVQAEHELKQVLENMPERVAEQVQVVLQAITSPERNVPENASDGDPDQVQEFLPYQVSYADLDGDGRKELIVQSPFGAHGMQAEVFTWDLGWFRPMGYVSNSDGRPFEVVDFDNDGRLELAAYVPDISQGHAFVDAPRFKVYYRWDGSKFAEVARHAGYR